MMTPTLAGTDRRDAPRAEVDPADLRPLRIVLIDGREERRAITDRLVERCEALTVVGLAGTLVEAEALIRSEDADVALLEIQMPVAHGIDMIGALRAQFPELRVVVSSFHADAPTQLAAREQGADAYLVKPLDVDELVRIARHRREVSAPG